MSFISHINVVDFSHCHFHQGDGLSSLKNSLYYAISGNSSLSAQRDLQSCLGDHMGSGLNLGFLQTKQPCSQSSEFSLGTQICFEEIQYDRNRQYKSMYESGLYFKNNEKLQCKFKLENEQSFLQEEGENETND